METGWYNNGDKGGPFADKQAGASQPWIKEQLHQVSYFFGQAFGAKNDQQICIAKTVVEPIWGKGSSRIWTAKINTWKPKLIG